MKKFFFDVFKEGRFFATVFLLFPKNWIFSEDEIVSGIEEKYPSLKGQQWSLQCA